MKLPDDTRDWLQTFADAGDGCAEEALEVINAQEQTIERQRALLERIAAVRAELEKKP